VDFLNKHPMNIENQDEQNILNQSDVNVDESTDTVETSDDNQEEDVEKHKRCIETVDKIMSLFPNTELTPLTMAFHAGAAQKLYSEEDMRNVIKLAVYSINPMLLGTDIFTKEENRVIQSLQKKQFPIAVEFNPSEAFPKLKYLS